MKHKRTLFAVATLIASATAAPVAAAVIVVGPDGTGPAELVSQGVSLLGTFGAEPSSAAALDGNGRVFTATPGDTASTIYTRDTNGNVTNSFVFQPTTDNGFGSPAYITDMAWGGTNTLWVSVFNGFVYHVAVDGTILSSFDTGNPRTGVTTDGTYVYTTSGAGFDAPAADIVQRNADGSVVRSIYTGLNDTLGIGYDTSAQDFWIGGFDIISHVAANGNILNTSALAGVNTGVEVGDVGVAPPPPAGVPEPATVLLTGGSLALLTVRRRFLKRVARALPVISAMLVASAAATAAVTINSIAANPPSPQPVGTPITITASASDTSAGELRYRFRVRPSGGTYSMIRDYGVPNSLDWAPANTEGSFDVEVSAKNLSTGSTATSQLTFVVLPRANGSSPVVSATAHPLVALYSAPASACPAGSSMRVRFKRPADVYWQSTPLKNCTGATSVNFYIAGMRPTSAYDLRHDVISGPRITTGPTLTFTTGAVGVTLPTTTGTLVPPTSLTEPITLFSVPLASPNYAVDANANVVWYYPGAATYLSRPVRGGGAIFFFGQTPDIASSGFRQVDLAGYTVKETSIERLNEQLAAINMHPITSVHHDARRLDNGDFMMLGQTERISSAQGGTADILGDMILVLDNELRLKWAWDAFDHLDVTRRATLGETCANVPTLCVLLLDTVANDWTHGNSIALTPDNNILYSARHQDFVYKINYASGLGDGHVMWRLGKDGDFTWLSNDPYPWESHQHDAEYESSNVISLFDNGNTRIALNNGAGDSRGQVLQIDETNMTVTPLMNQDVGTYSFAVGSAQRLNNGNYMFDSGFLPPPATEVTEFTPSGTLVSRFANTVHSYRSFRLRDLYSAP